MTLLLKISKTKKRLSNDKFIFLQCLALGVSSILAISAYSFRLLSFPHHWAITDFDIPIVQEKKQVQTHMPESLQEETPAILMSKKRIFFASLGNARPSTDPNESYELVQREGLLELKELAKSLNAWLARKHISKVSIAVVVPEADTPLFTLLQVVNHLRNEKIFDTVVLSGGFI